MTSPPADHRNVHQYQLSCLPRPRSRPNVPSSGLKKVTRLSEARLQAVSSRNMYSEQGLDALMRPSFGHVCHSLIVVSNWTPGSAQAQAL